MKKDICLDVDEVSNNTSGCAKFPMIFTDTPTGEPITLTEEEFNNLVELFRLLAAVRDRNKTVK
jgi:hypothetical protein